LKIGFVSFDLSSLEKGVTS